jgi:hypothetical protein
LIQNNPSQEMRIAKITLGQILIPAGASVASSLRTSRVGRSAIARTFAMSVFVARDPDPWCPVAWLRSGKLQASI